MSRIFAYCRISTLDQTTENQRREIESAGFKIKPQQIIEEHISGSAATSERPGFSWPDQFAGSPRRSHCAMTA